MMRTEAAATLARPPRGAADAARAAHSPATTTFVTMVVCDQLCGLPMQNVREIIVAQSLTRIPLAPPEIAGSLNLRGRIVTAIDLRRRLNLPPRPAAQHGMSVVVERAGELYSLVVDAVREVLELESARLEPSPLTLAAVWRNNSAGICRLDHELLVILDPERVLAIGT